MIADSRYELYGPVGCCAFPKTEYGKIFIKKRWKATTHVDPEVNLTEGLIVVDNAKGDGKRVVLSVGLSTIFRISSLPLNAKGEGFETMEIGPLAQTYEIIALRRWFLRSMTTPVMMTPQKR